MRGASFDILSLYDDRHSACAKVGEFSIFRLSDELRPKIAKMASAGVGGGGGCFDSEAHAIDHRVAFVACGRNFRKEKKACKCIGQT